MSEVLTPDFQITLGQTEIAADLAARVEEIVVHRHLDRADGVTVRLRGAALLDEDPVPLGSAVGVRLGWAGDLSPVFTGEITAHTVRWTGAGSWLLLRGMDKGHRLRRGAAHRLLTATGDAAAVSELARDAGLTGSGEDTGAVHPRLALHGESPWAFLAGRARRLGYRLGVSGDTVKLAAPTYEDGGRSAAWTQELQAVDLIADLAAPLSAAVVPRWDLDARTGEQVKVGVSDLRWPPGSATPGGTWGARALSVEASQILEEAAPASASEARIIGAGWLQRSAERFLAGPVTLRGDPRLTPGTLLTLTGLGADLSGSWLITGLTHLYTQSGFTTRAELARSAL